MTKHIPHPFVGKYSLGPAGRPKKSDMKKITVTLSEKQISWLDQISNGIRDSGAIVDRSTLIRGIIGALGEEQVQEVIRKISQKP